MAKLSLLLKIGSAWIGTSDSRSTYHGTPTTTTLLTQEHVCPPNTLH